MGYVLALLDDPVERLLVDERLSTTGELDVRVVGELKDAVAAATRPFDAVVVDLACVAGEPPILVDDLLEAVEDTPIVVVGEGHDVTEAAAALDAGVEAFVPRASLEADALLLAVRRCVARDERRLALDRLAYTDPLTGLLNNRGFLAIASRALEAAERLGSRVTLLYLDVDDLEQINAAYGYSGGDAALRETATLLRDSVRTTDIVARVGDDEFCIALTDGSPPAREVAHALGRAFDERNSSRETYLLSLTLGVAESDEWRTPTLTDLVVEAQSRLSAAKLNEAA